jgi:hypothetical protein
MASFQVLLSGLRRAEQDLEQQLGKVRSAIASLAGGKTSGRRGRPAGSKNKRGIIIVGGRRRRKMSAKARKAISDAQKARWAKQRAGAKK